MAKPDFSAQLKKRMTATQQASELQTGDDAYQKIFQKIPSVSTSRICKLPLDRLVPFFTADIGFKPYPTEKLNAFAEHLRENGLLVRIIVRPVPNSDTYEILAGHNRTAGARLAGWTEIEAEVVEADDARAITIATSTNLLQRQDLTVIERGKAYKALLDAKNRNGQRNAADVTFGDNRQRSDSATSGENRQKYNARTLVAEFFGVTEYEIRKAVKLTQLIPSLQDILENTPKKLNLACADLIADYDAASQEAFAEMCGIKGYALNIAAESNRRFAIIHFSGAGSYRTDLFYPKAYTMEDKMRAAETFLDGGTNFETPMSEALCLMKECGFENADIVFITDGECELSEAFTAELRKEQTEKHFTITGILLDQDVAGMDFSLKTFCQNIYRTSELTGDDVVRAVISERSA